MLDGAAGTGKTSFARRLVEDTGLAFCPRVTCRQPRGDGDEQWEYEFISDPEFNRMVAEQAFAAYRVFLGGVSYGLPRAPVEALLEQGRHVLSIVDLGTVGQIKECWPDSIAILLISPVEEIERRLRAQTRSSEEQIQEKLLNAANALSLAPYYDYVVPNRQGRMETAFEELKGIVARNS